MDWSRDMPDWPLHDLSRRIAHRSHQWHVQETGQGPTILLLHGAGSTTHTWRDMLPRLADAYHVVALDLPGQGFTRAGANTRFGLQAMTEDISALCTAQGWRPYAVIGHSAGAAIALNLAGRANPIPGEPPKIVGINAALGHFEGIAAWLFPLFAKILAFNPLSSYAFTIGGPQNARARRLIESTGSTLPQESIALYARLLADRSHVDGTLQMMAQWNINPLLENMSGIAAQCLLLTGENDTAVAPKVSHAARRSLPNAELVSLPRLGHLAHEEDPETVFRQIARWLCG